MYPDKIAHSFFILKHFREEALQTMLGSRKNKNNWQLTLCSVNQEQSSGILHYFWTVQSPQDGDTAITRIWRNPLFPSFYVCVAITNHFFSAGWVGFNRVIHHAVNHWSPFDICKCCLARFSTIWEAVLNAVFSVDYPIVNHSLQTAIAIISWEI